MRSTSLASAARRFSRFLTVCGVVVVTAAGLTSCESTGSTVAKKKRPLLPGEEMSDLSWSRPTGPGDVPSPMGLTMSR